MIVLFCDYGMITFCNIVTYVISKLLSDYNFMFVISVRLQCLLLWLQLDCNVYPCYYNYITIFTVVITIRLQCLPLWLQYEAKRRASASEGMRHAFFNSFGPSVHRLPDCEYL